MKKLLFCLMMMLVPSVMMAQGSFSVSNAFVNLLDGNGRVQKAVMDASFSIKENGGTPKSVTFNTSTNNASTNTTVTFKANNINYSYVVNTIGGKKWTVVSLGSSSYFNSVVFMMPQDGGVGTCTIYTLNGNKTSVVSGIEVQLSPSKCNELFTFLKNFVRTNKVNKASDSQTL